MKRIAIIGAGPAGLTAAYELLKNDKDCDVVVLEANDTVGGISKTVRYNGNRMDIGGHRFFSKDERIMSWWENILPLQGAPSFDDKELSRNKTFSDGGPDPEFTDNVMLIRDRVSRIYYNKKFFDYPITLKPATLVNMGFLTTLKAGFSYLHATIKKREENSLENFYINHFGKVLYNMFFEGYTEKLWGRHPSEISADWGAQRVKGVSIGALFKNMFSRIFRRKNSDVETSLIESFWYPKYGPGQLWEEVAAKVEYMGGKILTGCSVESLHKTGNKIDYIVCDYKSKRLKLEADVFISSMDLKTLFNSIAGDVPDKEIVNIASGLPYRDFITVGVLLNKINLKNNTNHKTLGNIVPDCWIYVQDNGVKLGRIQIFNNWSPYMVADPKNTVWLGLEYFCDENDGFWNMSDSEISNFAIKELVKMGVTDENAVVDYNVERVKKAYPAYFDTYKDIDKVVDYLNATDNLYCVGRNGQHRYNNMDHSMLTAIYAARAIITGEGKDMIFSVNVEKEYHETKKRGSE